MSVEIDGITHTREKGKERENVCVLWEGREREREGDKKRERVCVCMYVYVCVCECVTKREKERECVLPFSEMHLQLNHNSRFYGAPYGHYCHSSLFLGQ